MSIISKLRRLWPVKPTLTKARMEIYSQEYLDKLAEEHTLVCASVGKLQQDHYYLRTYGPASTTAAINNLVARRIELEVKIELISDHLS